MILVFVHSATHYIRRTLCSLKYRVMVRR